MPALMGNTVRESMVAGADLSTKQFYAVKMNSTDRTVVLAGNGEAAFGILIGTPTSGAAATVVTSGRVTVEVGTGGITAGSNVGIEAGGKIVAAASGDVVIGVAVYSAAAGTRGTIDFFRGGNVTA